jgi:hypothetical protein
MKAAPHIAGRHRSSAPPMAADPVKEMIRPAAGDQDFDLPMEYQVILVSPMTGEWAHRRNRVAGAGHSEV